MPDEIANDSAARTSIWREDRDLPPLIERVRPFTMVPHASLVDLARQVSVVVSRRLRGALVECGAWRGGASFLMAAVLRQCGVSADERKVWMFDSFEGIPDPQKIDGAAAKAWAEDKNGPLYFDKLRVSVDAVRQSAEALGLASYTQIVPGWFDQTLAATKQEIGPIALLRIDADWHASVNCCLDELYDQVIDGGFIVFDDYYTYDGCAIAVHEFLGRRGLAHRIEAIAAGPVFEGAVFRKGTVTWRWDHEVYLLAQALAEVISPDTNFILVDDENFRAALPQCYRAQPFLEHDGQYWGQPADDETAVRELERLRAGGATFIAFAWPALWWLEHYAEFAEHLQSRYRRVLQSGRLIIFELSPQM